MIYLNESLFLLLDAPINTTTFVTKEQLDNLPTMISTNYDDACSICSNELLNNVDVVKTLDCSHQFHRTCLQNWFSQVRM